MNYSPASPVQVIGVYNDFSNALAILKVNLSLPRPWPTVFALMLMPTMCGPVSNCSRSVIIDIAAQKWSWAIKAQAEELRRACCYADGSVGTFSVGLKGEAEGNIPAGTHGVRAVAGGIVCANSSVRLVASDPVTEALAVFASESWRSVMPGFERKAVEVPSYKLQLSAWRFDPAKFSLDIALQRNDHGSTAGELRAHHGALLAINGGFFNFDAKRRLIPVGVLHSGGRRLSALDPKAGSAVLYEKDGQIGITWSKQWEAVGDGVKSAVQAGPMVVDPGATNGIYTNDFIRHDRTSVCLAKNGSVVVLIVKGGLSLFELGEILVASRKKGGMECERAINLDGGPSTQASFAPPSAESVEIAGISPIQNAVLIRPRN